MSAAVVVWYVYRYRRVLICIFKSINTYILKFIDVVIMATDNIVSVIASLGNKNALTLFEMVMSGETCGCKLAEKLGVGKAEVEKIAAPMVASGIILEKDAGEWKHYSIDETQMCLLNKYFNDNIEACRSTGCKCKCNSGCC